MNPSQDAALAAIRDMWAGRSAAERSAFAAGLPTAPADTDTGPDEGIARVRVRAALSGAVDPAALVSVLAPADRPGVLDSLAAACDRSHEDGTWRWTMRSGPRRETLHGLTPEALVAALADVGNLATDEAGRYLRLLAARVIGAAPAAGATPPPVSAQLGAAAGVVTGASGDYAASVAGALAGTLPASVPAEPSPRVVLQALAWAEPLGGFAGDLAEARRRVRVEAIADSYGALLGNGFFGRERELARLREFASAPVTPAGRPVPVLPVVGLGGAGKSTVLAAFAAPYLREILRPGSTGPAVIVLDLDRVQFRIDAELELSFEVSRQLGDAHPVAAADFSALRHQVRQARAGTAAARYPGSLAAGEGTGDAPAFARDASLLVRMHGLDRWPVLLILDTFEEWQRERLDPSRPRLHDNDPEARVLHWIAGLRDTMELHGLRVILSGRADVAIDAAGITGRVAVSSAIRLADLTPPAAAELLRAHGVPAGQAPAIAGLVGGNPLTLRVAARFFAHLPAAEREDFVAGRLGVLRGLDGELRREVLYQRFLGHIPDPRVRRLAHPGLVLRRVTPGLIRHVLAPYCGLGALTDDDATGLLDRLADEVWLVTRDGDELHHLPDVRRAMLHLMTTDPAHAATLRAIHLAATRWYDRLPGEEAATEALYHRLMLAGTAQDPAGGDIVPGLAGGGGVPAPAPQPGGSGRDRTAQPAAGGTVRGAAGGAVLDQDDPELAGRLAALGDSVAELPPAIAAEARLLRGELPPLPEALLLRDAAWVRWLGRRGRSLVDNDAAAEALALLDARPAPAEPEWLAQACCDLARWDEYGSRSAGFGGARTPAHRYQTIVALVSGVEIAPPAVDPETLGGGPGFHGHVLTHYYYRLLLGQPDDIGRWRRAQPLVTESAADLTGAGRVFLDLFPVDEVRRGLVWVAAGCPGGAITLQNPVAGIGTALSRELISGSPELLRHLRGDNPELRAAVRTAVAGLADPELPDVDAITRVDRAGELGDVLDRAAARHPGVPSLSRVRDAFRRWDHANHAVLDAIVRDAAAGWPGT